MNLTAELFRLLGDSLRLRMVRLLSREKLNVTELTSILGVAQSGVSRHLRLLREAGLVRESREAGWVFYSVPQTFSDGFARIWPALQSELQALQGCREDDVRLEEILRQRHEDFREKAQGSNCPGRSWAAWARTLGYLAPHCVVADLGCGEGYLTLEVARWAHKVIAIDRSAAILKRARDLARKHRARNITFKQAELERLPLSDHSADVALLSQVLHCVKYPQETLSEAYRILKPDGVLLVQELRKHEEEWVREKLGDARLGFNEKELRRLLQQAGFQQVRLQVGSKRRGDPFTVLIGCGRKRR